MQSLCWRSSVVDSHRKQIVELAVKSRLPAMYVRQSMSKPAGL